MQNQDTIEVLAEINFDNCTECGHELEESESVISDICDGCRPAFLESWEAQQDAAAEEATERRRFPEESDDDLYQYRNRGLQDFKRRFECNFALI